MSLISKFIGSKVSGYLLIGMLVALAGAGYWFWSELKEFGSLEAKADSQADTIQQQRQTLEALAQDIAAKDEALAVQEKRTNQLRNNARLQQLAVQEAIKHANKALTECMAMHIASGMSFGPSRENGSGEDKASSGVDG